MWIVCGQDSFNICTFAKGETLLLSFLFVQCPSLFIILA